MRRDLRKLNVETASIFIYEPFTLRLEVECDAAPDTPESASVPDLAVTAFDVCRPIPRSGNTLSDRADFRT